MFQMARDEAKAILIAMAGATAWDDGSIEVRLFKNDVDPQIETVVGDLDEADFDGYAAITDADFSAPVLTNDNTWEVIMLATAMFICTGNSTPNTVYGYYLIDGNGVFLGAERFDEPQQVVKADDTVSFTPKLAVSLTGAAVVEN